jgi:MoaA/NifB/PqqE/SkfB family radical SAM enzyme
MKQSFSDILKAAGIRQAMGYLEKDPEKNLPKLANWMVKLPISAASKQNIEIVKGYVMDPENNWHKLAMSAFTDIDPEVRKHFVESAVIKATLLGIDRRIEVEKANDCSVPWAIIIDPTTACNLKCTGCWAADYSKHLNLTLEEMDNVIRQGTEMGTYFYIFAGGEPTCRKEDMFKLCEMHPECAFLAFTNGTLVDEAFADEMLRVGNLTLAFSVEGFEANTDSRRGKGTYQKIIDAMDILRRKKLFFGMSCCYTRLNTAEIGSDEFFDFMIEKGVKYAWMFTYVPVGEDASPDLLATAEQRKFMYRQIRKWRSEKPIFTMDFWNDGEYVNGCIAAGRCFLHINANGDIEPCAFIHYADCNIRKNTLLEAYKSPLFTKYRSMQPFNKNMLRPCPLLDNYGKLAEIVDAVGAPSTDMAHPEDVHSLCDKCKEVSQKWTPVADDLWTSSNGESHALLKDKSRDNG